ncbi:MAG: hypothetical protein ABMB14_11490 [Myxococcota bacterium]
MRRVTWTVVAAGVAVGLGGCKREDGVGDDAGVDPVDGIDPAGDDDDQGDDDDGTTPPPRDPTTSFAADATSFDVPDLDLGGTGPYSIAGTAYYLGAWSTFDIDGDGLPDLVHTADPDGELHVLGGPSDPHWDVYRNKGGKFSGTATRWAVPALELGGTGLFATGGAAYFNGAWSTFDLDGDGLPDLVHTADPDGDLHVLGAPADIRWDVYRNTGDGFAADPIRWAVPELALGGTGLYATFGAAYYTGAWSTLDVDADGLPDLIHTADAGGDLHVLGAPDDVRWDVYRNRGDGFAASATRWAVPELPLGGTGLYATGGGAYYTGAWSTFDLDGDGFVDLVHTADAAGDLHALGAPDDIRWDVYLGDGGGFDSAATRWAVPELSLGGTGLYATFGAAYYTGAWATIDIDADGLPDLVHTADPGPTLEVLGYPDAAWDVYLGE